MKHIKTFEQYSPATEVNEELFGKLLQGGKDFIIDGKSLAELKTKYANVVKDGQVISKAKEQPLVTIEEGKPLRGNPPTMARIKELKAKYNMDDAQALEATLKIYDWNGNILMDGEKSTFDTNTKKFTVIQAKSTRGTGFNVS
jgi:hypothetical protein